MFYKKASGNQGSRCYRCAAHFRAPSPAWPPPALGTWGERPGASPLLQNGRLRAPLELSNQEKGREWQQLKQETRSRIIFASSGETCYVSGHPAGWATRVAHET